MLINCFEEKYVTAATGIITSHKRYIVANADVSRICRSEYETASFLGSSHTSPTGTSMLGRRILLILGQPTGDDFYIVPFLSEVEENFNRSILFIEKDERFFNTTNPNRKIH